MPKFEREIEIDAPVEKVWQVMTDPAKWPQWFPGVDAITMASPVSEGAVIEWTAEDKVGRSAIVKMLPLKRLEIMTQVDDDKDMHVFELRPSGGFLGLSADECKVEYTLDTLMGGGILGNFVAGGNPKDAMRVKKAMHMLRRLVESL
ncbi:MAG: SRPBCC family protein [Anaerolineae bacterium]|nr:SRPBCC family protein [Anaerolineae bacterium]